MGTPGGVLMNGTAGTGGQPVSGPVFDGALLVGVTPGVGVFGLSHADGSLATSFPGANVTTPGMPSLAAGTVFTGLVVSGTPALLRGSLSVPGGAATSVPISSPITAAPVVGDHGLLYTAGVDGRLRVWSQADLSARWSIQLSTSPFTASPNLACGASGGRPGTLYVASEGGLLHALVVDSHAFDPSSPWPRYQHDARNTGNPATSTLCPE
jgi:hypothetical protein